MYGLCWRRRCFDRIDRGNSAHRTLKLAAQTHARRPIHGVIVRLHDIPAYSTNSVWRDGTTRTTLCVPVWVTLGEVNAYSSLQLASPLGELTWSQNPVITNSTKTSGIWKKWKARMLRCLSIYWASSLSLFHRLKLHRPNKILEDIRIRPQSLAVALWDTIVVRFLFVSPAP